MTSTPKASEIHVAPASAQDFALLEGLVREAGLPTEGLRDQFPSAYVMAVLEGRTMGCAGLEVYGKAGLLRSLAVRPAARSAGVGRLLVIERIDAARSQGLDAIYLLTTTAAEYFPRLGFRAVDRASLPQALAAAPEVASVCPASATCLALWL